MELYRHYKNNYYRLLGTVRHSESLEELALYECLYLNEMGQTWVRPRELFFGQTEVNGQEVARFAKVNLNIKTSAFISGEEIEKVKVLSRQVFGNERHSNLEKSLLEKPDPFLILAEIDGAAVGYKLGYRQDSETFYSWLGGVLPSYQRLGIGTDLLRKQHEWCRAQGYKKIQTKTGNRFPSMMILNIKSGFAVHSTEISDGEVRIIMEKSL